MSEGHGRIVSIEIYGQRYPVRSNLDPGYLEELARYVDAKMRAAADTTPSGETVKIAVLAAINIADEYFRYRLTESPESRLLERAEEIERLVDEVLSGA